MTEGTVTGCTQGSPCTFTVVLDELNTHTDTDTADPRNLHGFYFGFGQRNPGTDRDRG